jgi:hypothetical protein
MVLNLMTRTSLRISIAGCYVTKCSDLRWEDKNLIRCNDFQVYRKSKQVTHVYSEPVPVPLLNCHDGALFSFAYREETGKNTFASSLADYYRISLIGTHRNVSVGREGGGTRLTRRGLVFVSRRAQACAASPSRSALARPSSRRAA